MNIEKNIDDIFLNNLKWAISIQIFNIKGVVISKLLNNKLNYDVERNFIWFYIKNGDILQKPIAITYRHSKIESQ